MVPSLSHLTVAVTGATGFVGSHIALALADTGAKTLGVVRTPTKGEWMASKGVAMRAGDLTDRASLVRAFQGVDVLVSNAALGSGGGDMAEFERVNCEGTRNVFEAAAEAGITRVIHISTVAVYRTRLWRAMDEGATPYDVAKRRFNPSDITTDWRYARTKTLAEQICWQVSAARGLQTTALRPGPVYGSRDTKATAKLLKQLEAPLKFAPTVGVPWVHAGDVAQAVVGAINSEASIGQSYNLAGPPVSLFRFLRTMKRVQGRGSVLLPIPVPVWVRFDTTAAHRDLGFAPRDLETGLREALAQ